MLQLGRPDVNGLRTNKNVKGLVKALGWRKDRHVRGAAATALGQICDPRAVEPLTCVLNDENEKVRRATAEALSLIRDPLAVEPLIGVLKDNDRLVREYAARALGKIGDPHAVEPLIGAFNDQNANVRMAAAAALDALAWSPATSAAGAAYWVAKQQWEKCVQIAAVEPLIAALHDRSLDVDRAAARSLVNLYSSGKLDEGQKARVLAQRAFITYQDHVPEHEGVDSRDDETIGVDFPL